MRLALFADVHGNKWAMEAVMEAIRRERVDTVVFLGDAVLRVPKPTESMQMIRETAHFGVRGNYDWFVIGNFPGEKDRFKAEPFLVDEIAWTKERLTDDDIHYLKEMPTTLRFFEGEENEIVISHASPEKVFGGIFPPPEMHHWGMTDEECMPLLEGEKAPTVICAHTHAVMDRTIDRYRVINPGSVSFGWNEEDELDSLARWALMTWEKNEWNVEFRAETYRHEKVWQSYRNWSLWPMLRQYEKPKWWGDQAKKLCRVAGS